MSATQVNRTRTALASWNRPLTVTGLAMLAGSLVCLALMALDSRQLLGQPIWLKPWKFTVSMAIFCLSWAWLMKYVPDRFARAGRALAVVLSGTAIVEMIWIAAQAARGRVSHFNISTTLDTTLFAIAGSAILVLWIATAALTLLVWKLGDIDAPLRMAIRCGALISLAGMAIAFLMTQPTPDQEAAMDAGAAPTLAGAHSVGVPDGGAGLPVVGWSTGGGDLRIGHFVGIHALQLLPLVAAALAAASRRWARLANAHTRTQLVAIAALGYAAVTALVTVQALRGQPLLRPDVWTAAGWLAIVVLVAALTAMVLRRASELPAQTEMSVSLVSRTASVQASEMSPTKEM
ncbi:hypothetical protein EK0264_13685 [Epidermidibacterium keratini]|uniref:Uncharacterized protein n=1 Tax=Epidermidibacterium keratini TaxID=1891644 RepID=A0A7L4YRP9_9ACTN|nr:hypothetical protein [Epidermidibacterium keratini]QHC01237.1 hypothetical protein EK0264_13685 [Epidermidibacterium keratini]